ncbi:phosphopantetheine-binding protein [Actinophytocola xinjiangensis]|uniref:Phosphopantetheine-binding protein n=1 Tax=Actinophytocola xinjiangensis TaxID=485602 RepID=A0A7Z0WSD0_9PSEU|nr:phosphopantetheine-binding protein [Actinophytocola xinjiangensis]OLF13977.1 phosphopantetheine-binding protein [Actinophytocola xinjiangensis]
MTEWPAEFDKLLRTYLPLLSDGSPLTASTSLPDLGLDSMSTVGLLLDVEELYGVRIPDDQLRAETFASAAALWSVVANLRTD